MVRVGTAIFIAAIAAIPAASAKDSSTNVQFDKGKTSKSITATIKGYDTATYVLGVGNGQAMSVQFSPSNGACYMNVIEPHASSAVHMGDVAGNEYSTGATKAGEYKIEAFMMRSAARRNETCKFTVTMEVTGTPQGGGSAMPTEDAMRKECIGSAAGMYGTKPDYVQLAPERGHNSDGTFYWNGEVDKGSEGMKEFQCQFDKSGKLTNVMATTSDGE